MRPPRPGQPRAAVQAAQPAGPLRTPAGGGAAAAFPAGLKEDGEPRRAEDSGPSAVTSHGVL